MKTPRRLFRLVVSMQLELWLREKAVLMYNQRIQMQNTQVKGTCEAQCISQTPWVDSTTSDTLMEQNRRPMLSI